MDAKELVTAYYNSEAFSNPDVMDRFIHKEMALEWRSSKGFLQLDKNDLMELVAGLKRAYVSYRLDIGHVIGDGSKSAAARYTHYVHAIENPNEEVVLGHFMVVWEVKENKLYRGYLMSQAG